MAQIKWQKRAEKELYRLLVKGFIEFGEHTANNFVSKVASINRDLSRFKVIYYYSESSDTIHVVDIWDMRREPAKLEKRIK